MLQNYGGDSSTEGHLLIVILAILAFLGVVCYLLERATKNCDLDKEELAELQQLAKTPSVASLIRTALDKRGRVRVADLEKARAEAGYQEWLRAEQSLKASVQFGLAK